MKKLELKEPFILFMVGTPLVGKSTFIRDILPNILDSNFNVVSRDSIILEHSMENESYNDTYRRIDNGKYIDRIMKDRFIDLFLEKKNVIIDMLNLSRKRRHNTSTYFNRYNKYAMIFPFLEKEEYIRRNKKRTDEENKNIPIHHIETLIEQYVPIHDEEKFTDIFKSIDYV
jgi:tRNA uridine 5-carbamoylmethylation protein Kti12